MDGGGGGGGDFERDEEAAERAELLRDRFRLSAVSIAESEARKQGMEIEETFVACVADLAFKFTEHVSGKLEGCRVSATNCMLTGPHEKYDKDVLRLSLCYFHEQLAKDVELFAQHAGRKSVNMEDAILTAHRNEHLSGLLRSFSRELKGKDTLTEKKRKRSAKKVDGGA